MPAIRIQDDLSFTVHLKAALIRCFCYSGGNTVQHLHVTSADSTTLRISWQPPPDLTVEEGYQVSYRHMAFLASGCGDRGTGDNRTFIRKYVA